MDGVNQHIFVAEYNAGSSLSDLSKKYGLSVSTIRYHVNKHGTLRSRSDGIKLASKDGKLGGGMRGKRRVFSEQHKMAISAAMLERGKKTARGVRTTKSGYLEYTNGDHKGRLVHVVIMETRLGRRILPDEHVHHIDGDTLNNSENNLALVTSSGHARLHRLQDFMLGNVRERNENGRFS